MTQQDDITQRVLTDDEIMRSAISACDSLNITRFHEIGAPSKTIMDDAGLLELGRAIESALLSKLRAPVTDERRCEHCDGTGDVHSIDGEWRGTCICPAGRALASAPVAVEQHDGLRTLLAELPGMHEDPKKGDAVFRCGVNGALNVVERRIRELLRSAPVAGEPFLYGIMGPDGKAHFEEFCVSGDRDELQAEVVDHLNRDNPEDGSYSVVALFRDAAPQASAENVRKVRADSFIAGFICAGGDAEEAKRQAPQFQACVDAGRKQQPQADKDGGAHG